MYNVVHVDKEDDYYHRTQLQTNYRSSVFYSITHNGMSFCRVKLKTIKIMLELPLPMMSNWTVAAVRL